MRIWSIHPRYLDAKGLVALWRETLLARNVLEGKTVGYRDHPQLIRFRLSGMPLHAINQYLSEIYNEACRRDYKFDREKIDWSFKESRLYVTKGQVNYEVSHLLTKLKKRDINKYHELISLSEFETHPLFMQRDGPVESWERTGSKQ